MQRTRFDVGTMNVCRPFYVVVQRPRPDSVTALYEAAHALVMREAHPLLPGEVRRTGRSCDTGSRYYSGRRWRSQTRMHPLLAPHARQEDTAAQDFG